MNLLRNPRSPRLPRQAGFTLIEWVLAAAVLALIVLAGASFLSPVIQYFQHGRALQQANVELRICLENMRRSMVNGVASTCTISTAATASGMQHNQINFNTTDGSNFVFYASDTPPSSIHMQWTPPGTSVANDKVLATQVTNLHFAFDDPNDPGIVHVVFQMNVALDSTHMMIIMPPTLTIRMIAP